MKKYLLKMSVQKVPNGMPPKAYICEMGAKFNIMIGICLGCWLQRQKKW